MILLISNMHRAAGTLNMADFGFFATLRSVDFFGLGSLTISPVLDSLGWAILHSLWQGALAAFIIILFRSAFKNARPSLRYGVQALALGSVVVAFFATFALYLVTPALVPSSLGSGGLTTLSVSLPLPVEIIFPALQTLPTENAFFATRDAFTFASDFSTLTPLIAVVWAIGFAGLMARYSLAFLMSRHLRLSGLSPVPSAWAQQFATLVLNLGVIKPVAFYVSDRVTGPMTFGFFKPIVLVPASFFTGLTPAEIEAVLLHEIAHIRRHDYLLNLIQTLAKTIFFYHPAVHFLSRLIDEDREQACDDIAVAHTKNPHILARALASLRLMQARHQPLHGTPLSLAATGPKETALMIRLKRLVHPESASGKVEHLALTLATFVLAVTLSLGALPFNAVASDRNLDPQILGESFNDFEEVSIPEFIELPVFTEHTKIAQIAQIAPMAPPTTPAPFVIPRPPEPPLSAATHPHALTPELAGAPRDAMTLERPKTPLNMSKGDGRSFTYEMEALDTALAAINQEMEKINQDTHAHISANSAHLTDKHHALTERPARLAVAQALQDAKQKIEQAQRQVEQAERHVKAVERQQAQREASVERAHEQAERQLERADAAKERAKDAAERKRDAQALRVEAKAMTHQYKAFQTELTSQLRRDGFINSKSEVFDLNVQNGNIYLNRQIISSEKARRYKALVSKYDFEFNDFLKIQSNPKAFTVKSRDAHASNTKTIVIGSYTHSDANQTVQSQSQSVTKTSVSKSE